MTYLLPAALAAYLAGSVNVAVVLFKLRKKGDPRELHSGNPGVVNVYRVMGMGWAAVVLLLDVARAAGVGALALWILPAPTVPLAGLCLVVGNMFPVFHGFRGGKGVANHLGFTAWVAPVGSAVAAGAWVLAFALVRIPFVGSFAMVAVLSAATALRFEWDLLACAGTGVTAALIVFAHRSNFTRKEGTKEE